MFGPFINIKTSVPNGERADFAIDETASFEIDGRSQVFEEDIRRPQRVRDFTSQALSNMVWSFATLRWYPEKVLEAISAELLRRMPYLSVQVGAYILINLLNASWWGYCH